MAIDALHSLLVTDTLQEQYLKSEETKVFFSVKYETGVSLTYTDLSL